MPFLNYKPLKLQLRVFLASNTVAMVTYCVTKMVTTCSGVRNVYSQAQVASKLLVSFMPGFMERTLVETLLDKR